MKTATTPVQTEAAPTLKKVVVAQSLFIAAALIAKVPSFEGAEIITEYGGIRNKIAGCEVLGTQMDVSLASIAQVFHQCTLAKPKDWVETIEAMDAKSKDGLGLQLLTSELWSPMTYTAEAVAYSKWVVEAMKTPTEPLVLES